MLDVRDDGAGRSVRLASMLVFAGFLIAVPALADDRPKLTAREIVERAGAAVVVIETSEGEQRAQGSGFVVADDGAIATNLHVIEDANEIVVTFRDGIRIDEVSVRSFDVDRDLAVIVVELPEHAMPPTTLTLGDPSALEVGERIVVMGSPLGLEQTVTDGIVSAWREPRHDIDEEDADTSASGADLPRCRLMQISADLSSGSSGGPVLNGQAEVVGVASAGMRGSSGLNFAVPVDVLPRLVAEHEAMDLDTFRRRVNDARREKARPYFERSRLAYEREEVRTAFRLAEFAVRVFPRYEDALILSGRIALETGQVELAKERLVRAVAIDEAEAEGWYLLGLVHHAIAVANDDAAALARAEDHYRETLARDGGHAGASYRLAVILAERGQLRDAEELLQAAIDREPEFVDARYALGEVYLSLDRLEDAKQSFEQALWENDEHALSHFGLAKVYTVLDQTPFGEVSSVGSAAHHWEIFLRLSESDPSLAKQRAFALRIVGEYFPQLLDR